MGNDTVATIGCISVVGIVGLIIWRVGAYQGRPGWGGPAAQMAVHLIGGVRDCRARRMWLRLYGKEFRGISCWYGGQSDADRHQPACSAKR